MLSLADRPVTSLETHYRVIPKDRDFSFPAPVTAFVGRNRELAEIATRLSDPACRLLTLIGPGGIGKTRLAVESARHAIYPDGVYFVSLQSLTSPDQIMPAISEVLPMAFYNRHDTAASLLSYLHDKCLLLVLDNAEHLLDGVGLLSEILEFAPEVKLLVTTRERLHLQEEWVMEVQGLEIPGGALPEAAEDYSAVQLFVQCALRAGYQVREADLPFVIRICRMVSGCPLGIQLAAAWTRSLTCQQISLELQRSLDFMETTLRNVEPRHRNLRATFEPTWERLTKTEQAIFIRLSVFRGSFTLEAAEQVAGVSVRLLTTLVDKSLLQLDETGRYYLRELIRQFAEEKLEAAGLYDDLRDIHSNYYARFLEQIWSGLNSSHRNAVLKAVEVELDNIRTAWDWMLHWRKTAQIEASLNSLRFFLNECGRDQEAEQMLEQAAAALDGIKVQSTARRSPTLPQLVEALTERELEILRLIAEGFSNQAIADRLILSIGTVKWYSTQIYGKLGVQNRAQSVRRAQELNLFFQTQP